MASAAYEAWSRPQLWLGVTDLLACLCELNHLTLPCLPAFSQAGPAGIDRELRAVKKHEVRLSGQGWLWHISSAAGRDALMGKVLPALLLWGSLEMPWLSLIVHRACFPSCGVCFFNVFINLENCKSRTMS